MLKKLAIAGGAIVAAIVLGITMGAVVPTEEPVDAATIIIETTTTTEAPIETTTTTEAPIETTTTTEAPDDEVTWEFVGDDIHISTGVTITEEDVTWDDPRILTIEEYFNNLVVDDIDQACLEIDEDLDSLLAGEIDSDLVKTRFALLVGLGWSNCAFTW